MATNVPDDADDSERIGDADRPDDSGQDGDPDRPDEKYREDACYAIDSLKQIGSQWRLIVLYDLQNGEKRFNELKRSTDASSRTLSRVLDDLQDAGLVDRRLEEDAPVATYYSLTRKGASLCPVFDAIEEWGEEWVETTDADAVETVASLD